MKNFLLLINLIIISSCHGFYEPTTLSVDVPPGPPEFQDGWRAGCRSAMSSGIFANAVFYKPDFGNGVYQHESAFATGFGAGFFACALHTSTFVEFHANQYGPLE